MEDKRLDIALMYELRNWATSSLQYEDLPNDFGTMERFGTFIAEFIDKAIHYNTSVEYQFLSRIDSELFGKYALRKYYVDQCFFPPKHELCVDSYYDGLNLPISSKERDKLLKKYEETFSDIVGFVDFSDDLIDYFD